MNALLSGSVAFGALLIAAAQITDPLPRQMQFGVGVQPEPTGGLNVLSVAPGLTADHAGIRPGDVLLAADGRTLTTPADLVAAGAARREGDDITLRFARESVLVERVVKASPRTRESYSNAETEYGSVPFGSNGRLRTLFVTPRGFTDGPVVYLMQGHPCATVEALEPTNPYGALVAELVARGIAVYRIEKPGVGDSTGEPGCSAGGFELELDTFEAGWTDLTTRRGISNEKIFIFGHSMGGADAPLIAAANQDAPPRGVAVYGTLIRNVYDYLLDLMRIQGFLMSGDDPAEGRLLAERSRASLSKLLISKVSPDELVQQDPLFAQILEVDLAWDGREAIMGHPVAYWQDIAALNLVAAWRDTHSSVLSLYGESDFTALNDEDSVLIAQIVNHYRPGTARFERVALADHLMSQAPSRADAVGDPEANAPMLGIAPPRGLSPVIAPLLAEWIREELRKPSVSESLRRKVELNWFDVPTHALPQAAAGSRNGMAVVTGDIDSDGDLDVVIPNEFAHNRLLLNTSGQFVDASDGLPQPEAGAVPPPGPPFHDSEDAVIADFDRDGRLDIIVVSEDDFGHLNRRGVHEYYRANPAGGYSLIANCIPDTSSNDVASTDFNSDGWPDLIVVGDEQDRLLINDGMGCFREETDSRLPAEHDTAQDVLLVDVDADQDLDIVLGLEGGHRLLINDGSGHFADETHARLPSAGNVEARKAVSGDIDGDGDVDLFFAHVGWQGRSPQDQVLINRGDGYFADETSERLPVEVDTTLAATLADFDADGDLDLATVGDRLRIFENRGGRFVEVSDEVLPEDFSGPNVGLAAADFNGDGAIDLMGSMLSRAPSGDRARDWLLLGRTKLR